MISIVLTIVAWSKKCDGNDYELQQHPGVETCTDYYIYLQIWIKYTMVISVNKIITNERSKWSNDFSYFIANGASVRGAFVRGAFVRGVFKENMLSFNFTKVQIFLFYIYSSYRFWDIKRKKYVGSSHTQLC